jgi:hypothetical protein
MCGFALQWEVVHEAEPAGFAQFHINGIAAGAIFQGNVQAGKPWRKLFP